MFIDPNNTLNKLNLVRLLVPFFGIVSDAGDAVLRIYAIDFEARRKADASPVTDADDRGEEIIVAALTLDFPVVSEEAAARGAARS